MQYKQVLKAGCYSRNPEVAPADICQIIAKGAWTSCGSELIAVWSDIHHWLCHRYMYIMILSCTLNNFWYFLYPSQDCSVRLHTDSWNLTAFRLPAAEAVQRSQPLDKEGADVLAIGDLFDGTSHTWRSPDVLLDQFCQHPPFITVETICTSDCQAITFAPESRTLREALFSHVMAVLQTWSQPWD